MPLRMAAPGARAVAPPSLPLPRLFLILCIVVALGVSLLFFLELYVGRDDDWDEVLAGEVVPAAPPVEAATEEPIEELGILPSEQWERDGKLIDWERDVEQQGAGADAQDSVAAPASDQVSDVAEADTAGEIATVATARDDARTPTAQEEVVGAASAIATGPVDATTAVVDEVAPPAAAPSVEVSAEESEQLLALLNEEAAAETYSVSFAFDSIALNREARDILAQAIDKLLAEPGYRAEIIGFSDYQGDEAYNLQLSIERARAVRDYFSEAGVPPQRLRVSGRGAQSEQGSAGINQRRQLRVVQIRLLDGLN